MENTPAPSSLTVDVDNIHTRKIHLSDYPAMPTNLSELDILEEMDASRCIFLDSRIPDCFFNLLPLQRLNMSGNAIKAIPDDISALTNLRQLNLSRNEIKEIPECLFRISTLQSLDVSWNSLYLIPESIKSLKCLRQLDLSNNRIRQFPSFRFDTLQCANLSGNCLESFEVGFQSLDAPLIDLDLSRNNLAMIPENINELVNLEKFNISENPTLREIPPSCLGIAALRELCLVGNDGMQIPPQGVISTNDISTMRSYFRNLYNVTAAFQMIRMRESAAQQDVQLVRDLYSCLSLSDDDVEGDTDVHQALMSSIALQLLSGTSTCSEEDASRVDKAKCIVAKLTRASHEMAVEILALFPNPSFYTFQETARAHGLSQAEIEFRVKERKESFARSHTHLTQAERDAQLERDTTRPVGNLNLMREMRLMQTLFTSDQCVTLAGTTLDDFERILSRVSPRILIFSGHATGKALAFENQKSGYMESMSVIQFQMLVEKANLSSLEVIVLNCCEGNKFAELFVRNPATEHIACICWTGKPRNSAAVEFSRSFCHAVSQQMGKDALTLFNDSCKQFTESREFQIPLCDTQHEGETQCEPILVRTISC